MNIGSSRASENTEMYKRIITERPKDLKDKLEAYCG